MGKNNIIIPEKFSFSTDIPIRITDINYGGHLGNDTFLSIIHEARVRYLLSLEYSEMNFGGHGLIMSDVAIDFKSEIKYGDIAIVHIAAGEIGKVHFDLIYQVHALRQEKKVLAANIRTGMVCFDYSLKKVRSIPEEALTRLRS